MPPLSRPEVVGWLLLFVPGFVGISAMSWLGWPATRRTQLHWLAYSVMLSLFCEVLVRWTIDRTSGQWVDPVLHPMHRAVILLLLSLVTGLLLGYLQYHWRFNRLIWWILKESSVPTIWLAYFRNPGTCDWIRIETTDSRVIVGHVDTFTSDPGDTNQELVLTDAAFKDERGWKSLPGPMYINARQIAFAVGGDDREALKALGLSSMNAGRTSRLARLVTSIR